MKVQQNLQRVRRVPWKGKTKKTWKNHASYRTTYSTATCRCPKEMQCNTTNFGGLALEHSLKQERPRPIFWFFFFTRLSAHFQDSLEFKSYVIVMRIFSIVFDWIATLASFTLLGCSYYRLLYCYHGHFKLRICWCLARVHRVMDARGKFGEQEKCGRVAWGAAESNSGFLSARVLFFECPSNFLSASITRYTHS